MKFFITAVALLISASVNAQVIDRIVAVVNSDVLTLSELERSTSERLRKASSISDPLARADARKKVLESGLEQMISDTLIQQEARKRQIVIRDKDVNDRIEGMKAQQRWDDATFARYLQSQGMTLSGLKETIRKQLLNQRIVGMVLGSRVQVSQTELKDYYREKSAQSSTEFEISASHILLKLPASATAADESAVRYRAEELVQRLNAGEAFETLAKKYSEGPAGTNGGKLGVIRKGFLEDVLENAFFGLKPGVFSSPVRSSFGYHVLLVHSRKAIPVASFEELAPQLTQELQRKRIDAELGQWVATLRNKSFVEVRL